MTNVKESSDQYDLQSFIEWCSERGRGGGEGQALGRPPPAELCGGQYIFTIGIVALYTFNYK